MMSGSIRVTAHTRLFCLLGDPVSHSKSPAMMNAAFAACGIDGIYLALRVGQPALGTVIQALREVGCGGINITAPHKQAVIPFMDKLSDTAEKTGSVNTIVFDEGRLTGHSTDGQGLVGALEERLGTPVSDKTVLILGAGGAARGVLPALIARGAGPVVIANRSEKKADALASELGAGATLRAVPLTGPGVAEAVTRADVVINATALPITSGTFCDIDLFALGPHALVFDMNYATAPAGVGEIFARRSIDYSDGLPMLLFQGAGSFSLWTGHEAPLSVMRSALGL